ncbi:Tm-1-like ATP-binding domain-containing protein [Pseudaminobacter sp. 19-2017]|uniref:Tm-1-like ATP-binding domain-containing protein n=1 Tax=Pseudaminobacter soli (ex Zhang et al. 2022) TaxID=2831468 RepID=A0A942E2B3_9HYPH|nr:Tm-1-like ATP-binding domain-containing protein [Pseudaminobacter soli]MBS3649868.1 Tm-1-like ATP-binding domain-containing protein [Pseudaminobacter soli]
MDKVVAVLGTFDSKGAEYAFLKDRLETEGVHTLTVDAGVLGDPPFVPDISAGEVAEAGGSSLAALRASGDRGAAMAAMARGAASIVAQLAGEDRIDGIISMGGGGGTSIAAAAMQALPVGFPKLLVSTLASGDVRDIVGVKDVTIMPAVVDIAGINRISARILANAAGAIAGMVKAAPLATREERPLIAATMFGVTTPCVNRAREELERAGYEVLVFHATGAGGRTMEELIRGGYIAGVLDITTTELADELVGGVLSAGPERLEAAGAIGIPQVVSAGALDMVNFGAADTVPAKFSDRKLYRHNPLVTLMRTTPEENAELGRILAGKLGKAKGPTVFLWPQKGVSLLDTEGKPFHDPAADAAFIDALKANLPHNVRLIELDCDINDEAFAIEAARLLVEVLRARQGDEPR